MKCPQPELSAERPSRVVLEGVRPVVDGGRFPIKRTVGEPVDVEADIHADGHEVLRARLLVRFAGEAEFRDSEMRPGPNDVWSGRFVCDRLGVFEYTVEAWVDSFAGWRRDLEKRLAAGQDVESELAQGALFVEQGAARAEAAARALLLEHAARLRGQDREAAVRAALAPELALLLERVPERRSLARHEPALRVCVERERARFSAWYELFPRSASPEPGRHGTFRDVEALLPGIAAMGFDVLYLPPIHPIGTTNRKGPGNRPTAGPGDPGSPWAIGSAEGGHTALHPELGSLADLRHLMEAARGHGLDLALDLAFQCSPDHPWVGEHPGWFLARPDGTIRHAENPPKKYEDIYPLDFECRDWQGLWAALRDVVFYWMGHGVHIFRVDNPHTKPYAFWEWLIAEARGAEPEVLFLSEAFTRPKVMYRLAKLGFSQSYTYFTWRNTAWELREYLRDLQSREVREFFRPNLWPNTPDILPEYLQAGGRAGFSARAVLAATLGASWGIYGPAFELLVDAPSEPGREEYLDSEKYQLVHWQRDDPRSLRPLIARLNRLRRDNPALQGDRSLCFHGTDNDQLLAYSKATEDGSNTVLVVVNLDPHHRQSGFVDVGSALGIDPRQPFQAHDLLGGARYLWQAGRNYVELDPAATPAHVFRIRRRIRREHDFDYFL